MSGLSRPTVDTAVRQMENVGMVVQDGYAESDSGRKPILWKLNNDSGYFFGIDLEKPSVRVVALNVSKEVVFSATHTMTDFSSEVIIEKIRQSITECMIDHLKAGLDKVKSISVGNPGDIDRQSGTSIFLQNCPEWKNVPIVSELQSIFDCPVYLENIILFMANSERDKMEDAGKEDFVYIALKTGVGAGVCIDGELYSGYKGNAGHLGHLPVMSPSAKRGKRLEECAGDFMILKRMKEYKLLENYSNGSDSVTKKELDILTDEAARENLDALRILEEIADYWAYAIATVICHLDISQFILGGMISYVNQRSDRVGQFFLDSVRKNCIEKYLFTEVPAFKLRYSDYDDYAAALGGALYGYENYFHQVIKVGEKSIAINVS